MIIRHDAPADVKEPARIEADSYPTYAETPRRGSLFYGVKCQLKAQKHLPPARGRYTESWNFSLISGKNPTKLEIILKIELFSNFRGGVRLFKMRLRHHNIDCRDFYWTHGIVKSKLQ